MFDSPGLQTSNKHAGYPVRMDNSVPIVPQNQSTQPLHIQPSMLTQVGIMFVLSECVSPLTLSYDPCFSILVISSLLALSVFFP